MISNLDYPYLFCYLCGTLLGEVGLLAWWAMGQGSSVTPLDYFRAKWGTALFSGVVALTGCLLWTQGTLLSYVPGGLTLSLGTSVAAGMILTFFAHGFVGLVGKRFGVEPDGK